MKSLLAACIVISLPAAISAAPIKFTYEGSGNGALNEVLFANNAFKITAVGNTDTWFSQYPANQLPLESVKISLSGLGEFDVTTPMFTSHFDSSQGPLSLFHVNEPLTFGMLSVDLGPWDLVTSLGPISVDGSLSGFDRYPGVQTSWGYFVFENGQHIPMTLTITVVPEPCAILLAGYLPFLLMRRTPR